MLTKKILFVIIVSIFLGSSAFSQDDATLIELIKEEQESLSIIEGEIQYFYSLIAQKKEINRLYSQGNLANIKSLFREDVAQIDKLFEQDDVASASIKIGELKTVYKDVNELQDQILFYRGKISYYIGKLDKAKDFLNQVVNNYPTSPKKNPAVFLLEELYFYNEMDDDFILIYGKYTAKKTPQQQYWYAHSLYNTGDLKKAKELFVSLSNDFYFGFRANAMLALIAYFDEGVENSINDFLILKNEYKANTEYYDFVILSLARLYSDKGDLTTSLEYYEQLIDISDGIEDEIIFEIATQYKNNSEYDKAIGYYYEIINNPVKSEFFTSAKFLVMLVEMERGNFDQVEGKLNEVISVNDLLLETLNSKYALLNKYAEIKTKLNSSEISETERTSLKSKADIIEAALSSTNKTMNDLYTGMNPVTLQILELLEEEYLSYNSTISEMDAVIKLANTIPNKKIPARLDMQIDERDTWLVTLQMIDYLGHMNQISQQDYEFAKALAIEKLYEEYLLEIWEEIEQIAIANNNTVILPKIVRSKELFQDNLRSLDVMAEVAFSGKAPEELHQIIQEESAAIEHNRSELVILKKDVIENFNKKIAKRLEQEKEILIEENELLKNTYSKAIDSIKDEVIQESDKYRISLLDVLFKQTQNLDEEYDEFQEQIKNE